MNPYVLAMAAVPQLRQPPIQVCPFALASCCAAIAAPSRMSKVPNNPRVVRLVYRRSFSHVLSVACMHRRYGSAASACIYQSACTLEEVH
jgi:hypothetical protein